MVATTGEITRLLDRWSSGDVAALDALMPLVFEPLRRLARAQFARESTTHTLQPTALVHEAYLYLIGRRSVSWRSRAHFLNAMVTVMRRLLVDHARARRAAKRGGDMPTVVFDETLDGIEARTDLVALDDALDALARVDPRRARVVELRFFAGLDETEIASVLGISTRTVARDWHIARLWLLHELDRAVTRS
ncbi:MAG: ECF-type sigma factor [Acidobacteriota bacterium]